MVCRGFGEWDVADELEQVSRGSATGSSEPAMGSCTSPPISAFPNRRRASVSGIPLQGPIWFTTSVLNI